MMQAPCKHPGLEAASFSLAAIAFFAGIPFGILSHPYFEDRLPDFLSMVFSGIMDGSDGQVILNIALQNTKASFIHMLAGIMIFPALVLLFINGAFLGIVSAYASMQGIPLTAIVLGIGPHGLFELPALFIASALGMRVGYKVAACPKNRMREGFLALKLAFRGYLLYVIPLLAVSACVEVLVSARIIGALPT